MDRIVGLLMQHTPEIICFQEANIKMLDILQGRLQHYGFTKFIQNITNDTYTFNFTERERVQHRTIFYKEDPDQSSSVVSGEIELTKKYQPYLVYKNTLIFSLHISYQLNLDTNMDENFIILANFIMKTINIARSQRIPKIVLIGDTNNTAGNLNIAIRRSITDGILPSSIRFSIQESSQPTFITDLNGGNKIDNVIDISL